MPQMECEIVVFRVKSKVKISVMLGKQISLKSRNVHQFHPWIHGIDLLKLWGSSSTLAL